jgi:hypothetical protein
MSLQTSAFTPRQLVIRSSFLGSDADLPGD